MLIPSAMQIEAAVDSLKQLEHDSPNVIAEQIKELHESNAASNSASYIDGYNLGLQTARVILATSTELILKGIDTEKIL